MSGHASEAHSSRVELDEEQDVETAEQDSVDREEVGGQDGMGLAREESAPARSPTGARGAEILRGEHSSDRRRRDADPETLQLSLNAQVAPARVLSGETNDQGPCVGRDGWATSTASRIGPASGYEPSVPPQQCLGRHHEGGPAPARQEPGGGAEEYPVGVAQPGTGDLALKDRQLVAEHYQLEILGSVGAESKKDEREHALRQDVDDGQNQDGLPVTVKFETLSEQHPIVYGHPPGRRSDSGTPQGAKRTARSIGASCSVDRVPIVNGRVNVESDLQHWAMPSRGEVWWAFGAQPSPVVILSSRDDTDLRAIHVVPSAETDISGVAIELPVGREEGLPSGVVRVALARQDRINCAWLVSLKETDLKEKAGALSEEKLSKLAEILRLGGLE